MELTKKIMLYPNQTMIKILNNLCDYRRYCWNQGLALWNELYDQRIKMVPADLRKNHNQPSKIKRLFFLKKNKNYYIYSRHHQIVLFEII